MRRTRTSSISKYLLSERGIIVLLTAAFMLISFYGQSFTTSLEGSFIRTAAGLKGGLSKPSSEITIAKVDESTEDIDAGWRWNQKSFTDLIYRLKGMRAKLIVVDSSAIIAGELSEPKPSKQQDDDVPIVMGYQFYPTLADTPAAKAEPSTRWPARREYKSELEGIAFPSKPVDDSRLPGMADINEDSIIRSSSNDMRYGFSNIFKKSSGLIVSQPLAVRFRGMAFPSLAVAAYSRWRGFTPILAEDPQGLPIGISVGDEHIPTGPDTYITINFRGESNGFPRIDVKRAIAGLLATRDVAGKIVIIAAEDGIPNLYDTVVGPMDNAEVQSNIIDNLLSRNSLRPFIGWRHAIPIFALLALCFIFGILQLPFARRLVTAAAMVASSWIIAFILLWTIDIWFPTVQLTLAIASIILALTLRKIFAVDIPRHRLSQLFGWRLSRNSIEEIVMDRSLIRAEGHERDITALAIDVKGFGHISDNLTPPALSKFLTEFRIIVSDIIIKHGGMIESWGSDDCLAVFGAPVPLSEHAMRACIAALELRKMISSHQGIWKDLFRIERLRLGFGIQKGRAVAGDFGIGYSIIGGAMEAAKQLRSQNRSYRTWALVGDAVYKDTATAMEYRPLDPVFLWGETSPTMIHELIGETGTILPSLRGYEEARKAYLEGNFKRAVELFSRILQYHPHDGPSRLFLRRAVNLANDPPDVWSGVWKT